jgi:hypothetical protein
MHSKKKNKPNDDESNHEDSDREPDNEKLSFQSDTSITEPHPALHSKK